MDDVRAPLLRLLRDHREGANFVSEEEEGLGRLEAFVASNPNCFERSSVLGHVTGSAFVVDAAHRRVLLLHHKKLGLWLQPGGHADGDPDVARVAYREAVEESGIEDLELVTPQIFDVDVHAIPARKREGAHFHYDVRFLLQAPAGREPVVSDESHDVRWVTRLDVPGYTRDRSVLRMLEKWSKGWNAS